MKCPTCLMDTMPDPTPMGHDQLTAAVAEVGKSLRRLEVREDGTVVTETLGGYVRVWRLANDCAHSH